MKDSTVNIGLIKTVGATAPLSAQSVAPGLIIISILNWLRLPPHPLPAPPQPVGGVLWTNIVDDFNCRVPVIHFTHAPTSVRFSLVIESECAYKTAVLIRHYTRIDPRLAVLTVAFRTFVRIGCLDQPELGTLPPHAYTLMVLFYMQQKRVLPVLHQMGERVKDDPESYMSKI